MVKQSTRALAFREMRSLLPPSNSEEDLNRIWRPLSELKTIQAQDNSVRYRPRASSEAYRRDDSTRLRHVCLVAL
jgi:hypothetical protein